MIINNVSINSLPLVRAPNAVYRYFTQRQFYVLLKVKVQCLNVFFLFFVSRRVCQKYLFVLNYFFHKICILLT